MNPWKCIPIYLVVDGDNAVAGLWCDECALPSVIRFPILSLGENGVGSAGSIERCMECDELEDGEDDGHDYLVRN